MQKSSDIFPLCIKNVRRIFSLNKQQFIIEISFEMWYNIYYTYFMRSRGY